MRTRLASSFLLTFVMDLILSGCASTYYYNVKYPATEQQRYYNADDGFCTQVAYGSIPPKQIDLRSQGTTFTSGNISGSYDGNRFQSHYSQTSTTYDPITSFANGYNLGSSIAADISRGRIHSGCMTDLGWVPIPCQTCIPQNEPSVTTIPQTTTNVRPISEGERIWENFLKKYPEFSDSNSIVRGLGDAIFDRDYAARVANGDMSYETALEETAQQVYELIAKALYSPSSKQRDNVTLVPAEDK